MRTSKFEAIVVLLLLLSTSIIYLMQQYSWNHSLSFDSNTPFPVRAISDANSVASIEKIDNKLVLTCEIIQSDYAWPFCEIAIQLHKGSPQTRQGIDLSKFETVNIHAQYQSAEPLGIRFQLRNFNNIYSNTQDPHSLKYSGIEYFVDDKTSEVSFPLTVLQVATWWIVEQKVAIEHSAPEFDNTMIIELATGNNMKAGVHKIVLDKIVFQGKRYSNEQVYFTIITLWVSVTIALFFYHLVRSRQQLSIAHRKSIELKRLNKLLNVQTQELKDQTERDPLTGALNRAGIKAVFTDHIPVLSIAFIDIDHFKKINDEHGHGIGDEVLKEFSALLSQNSRDTDFLARWGGEEFILVCPNTDLNKIELLSEAIRKMIESHSWPNKLVLTASFGVAQRGKESITDFIDRADKALYAAKAQGRNKVVSSRKKAE